MSSTDAQDRDFRRAAHAQRVDALRRQRERAGQEPRESITRSADPFALVASGQLAEPDLPF